MEQTAALAGGCFWGLQGVFEHVRGVHGVRAGNFRRRALHGTDDDVGTGHTGHAESVGGEVEPGEASYGELLQID